MTALRRVSCMRKNCIILRGAGGLVAAVGVHRAVAAGGGVILLVLHVIRVVRQRNAAVVAVFCAQRVMGAAVGADDIIRPVGNHVVRGPFKPGGVVCLMHADTDLFPAFAVVRCAAVRADNDIICFFEFLFAYGAGIALVISHVWSSEFSGWGSVILPIHLVPLRPKRRKRNNLAILYTICPWKAKNFS